MSQTRHATYRHPYLVSQSHTDDKTLERLPFLAPSLPAIRQDTKSGSRLYNTGCPLPVTAKVKACRRARHRAVCHHWKLAKRLSPLITKEQLENWLHEQPAPSEYNEKRCTTVAPDNFARVPSSSLDRIRTLLRLRQTLTTDKLPTMPLILDATIWHEIRKYKETRKKIPKRA